MVRLESIEYGLRSCLRGGDMEYGTLSCESPCGAGNKSAENLRTLNF